MVLIFTGGRVLLSPLDGAYYFNDEFNAFGEYALDSGFNGYRGSSYSSASTNRRAYVEDHPSNVDNNYQDDHDSDNGTCCSDGSKEMGQMPEIVKSYSLEL
jgi:hypothetical protein